MLISRHESSSRAPSGSDPAARAIGWAALAVLIGCIAAPIIVGREVLFPYVLPRAVFVRVVLGIGLALLLGLLFTRRYRLVDPRDPILSTISVFLLVAGASGLLGVSPQRSLFGEMERMWGLITWFYFLVFYALLRIFGWNRWRELLWVSVGVGLLVWLQALLQKLAPVLPISVKGASTGTVWATLGNPSYLSIYMVFQIGFAGLLLLKADRRSERLLCWGIILSSALVLTWGGGRSAFVGVVAGLVAGGLVLARGTGVTNGRLVTRARASYALAALGALAILAFSSIGRSNPLVQRLRGVRLDDPTFTGRFEAWAVAWNAFTEHPLVGIGYENFPVAFARYYPPAMDAIVSSSVWDRAHNLYLDLLASSGVLGLGAYLSIWIAYFWSISRAMKGGRASTAEGAILTAVGVAYLVYLLMWFEDHASTISLVLLFGYVGTLRNGAPLLVFEEPLGARGRRRALAWLAVGIIALFTWQHAVQVFRAGRLAVAARAGSSVEERLDLFEGALSASGPVGLVVVGLYTDYLRTFTGDLPRIRRNPDQARTLTAAIERGLVEVDRAIRIDPHNDVWWIDQSRLLALAAELTGSRAHHRAAIESMRRAIELSPTQPTLYHLLSELHLVTADADSALIALRSAASLEGNRARTSYFVSRAHRVGGDLALSRAALADALGGGEISREQLVWHLEVLERAGQQEEMIPLLEAYWTGRSDPQTGRIREAGREDFEIISRLPIVALQLGDVRLALRAAAQVREEYPAAAEMVSQFVRDVRGGHGDVWIPHGSLAMAATRFGGVKEDPGLRP